MRLQILRVQVMSVYTQSILSTAGGGFDSGEAINAIRSSRFHSGCRKKCILNTLSLSLSPSESSVRIPAFFATSAPCNEACLCCILRELLSTLLRIILMDLTLPACSRISRFSTKGELSILRYCSPQPWEGSIGRH